MPDKKTLIKIDKLGYEIDASADKLRKLKLGSDAWLKENNRLFNLIAKRDRLLENVKNACPA